MTRTHYTPSGPVAEPENAWRGSGKEADYKEALERLKTTPEHFLSAVVYSLTWGLTGAAANITGIYCDMWCGISAHGTGIDDGFIPGQVKGNDFDTWVECDEVEYGLATTWKAFVEHYGLYEPAVTENVTSDL